MDNNQLTVATLKHANQIAVPKKAGPIHCIVFVVVNIVVIDVVVVDSKVLVVKHRLTSDISP